MLEVKNLCKTYKPKKGVPVQALDNVNLNIQEKGMVFVLGKSGSGKSTFLNVLGGLDKADSGDIVIQGKSSENFSQADFDSYRNTYIGFVFQEYNILEEFTVGQNIALALQLQGKKATSEAINQILEEVDLVGYGKRKPNELSGGQLQRVAIARALIKNPEIIMADEPTGALDSNTGIQVFNTLKKLSKNKLVLIVSHDRDFAERYADRIVEFADGKIISDVMKYQAHASTESEGVNIIEDKFINIKKGYQLTNRDLEIINRYLKDNQDNETMISFEQRTNKEMKNFAHIDNQGNRESFKVTNKNELDIRKYTKDEYKKIRSRLPYLQSLKIGASSLKTKPIRLIITILMSIIAFTMLGFLVAFANYNTADLVADNMSKYNVQFMKVNYAENENPDPNDDFAYYSQKNMSVSDFDRLKSIDSNQTNFLPIYYGESEYNGVEVYLNNSNYEVYEKDLLSSDYFPCKIFQGAIECDFDKEFLINKYNMSVLGNLPKTNNEIALTKYQCQRFVVGNFLNKSEEETSNKYENIENCAQMIGKKIVINIGRKEMEMTVVGIIDTKLNDDLLHNYKTKEKQKDFKVSESNKEQFKSFQYNVKNGFASILFINKDFHKFENPNWNWYSLQDVSIQNEEKGYNSSLNYVNVLEKTNMDNIKFFDKSKITLNDNEIVLPLGDAANIFDLYGYNSVSLDTIPDEFKNMNKDELNDIYFNCKKNIYFNNWVTNDGNDNYCDDDYEISNYDRLYIYNTWFNCTALGDTIGNINKIEIFKNYLNNKIDEQIKNLNGSDKQKNSLISYCNYSNKEDNYDVNVVGILMPEIDYYSLIPDEYYINYSYEAVMNYNLLKKLNYEKTKLINCAIGNKLDTNYQMKKYLRKIIKTKNGYNVFEVDSPSAYKINSVGNILIMLKKMFLGIGIVVMILASFLLMNYISQSINNKKKEIGVLRAVGARGIDVYGIFFHETMIIAFINLIFASIATFALTYGINIYLVKKLQYDFNVLIFSYLQIVAIVIVSILSALLASFLPVFRIARKRPIDAIRKR